jgi:hypothetical protein
MKTVRKGDEIVRKGNEEADEMVKKSGWAYCKKEEWKKLVRDRDKKPVAKVSETAQKSSSVSSKKPISKYKTKVAAREVQ